MDKVTSQNRRTLDMLAAKCYYYYARTYELMNQLEKVRRYVHILIKVFVMSQLTHT